MTLADSFDRGYAAAAGSRRHKVFTEVLGLPPEVEPNSFLSMEAFTRIARELRVGPGDRLVDLACGRGGPGLLLAKLTGADLVGVDFSEVAVAHARERAPQFVPAGRASFRVGDLAATGLDDRCADAVVCIDSIQFAPDKDAAAREAYRILRPGGRYVQTNWQPVGPENPVVPERIRELRFAELLGRAGFTEITVEDRPDLAELVRQVFEAALAVDPDGTDGTDGTDEPLQRLQEEARFALGWLDAASRVLVIAERPV